MKRGSAFCMPLKFMFTIWSYDKKNSSSLIVNSMVKIYLVGELVNVMSRKTNPAPQSSACFLTNDTIFWDKMLLAVDLAVLMQARWFFLLCILSWLWSIKGGGFGETKLPLVPEMLLTGTLLSAQTTYTCVRERDLVFVLFHPYLYVCYTK